MDVGIAANLLIAVLAVLVLAAATGTVGLLVLTARQAIEHAQLPPEPDRPHQLLAHKLFDHHGRAH